MIIFGIHCFAYICNCCFPFSYFCVLPCCFRTCWWHNIIFITRLRTPATLDNYTRTRQTSNLFNSRRICANEWTGARRHAWWPPPSLQMHAAIIDSLLLAPVHSRVDSQCQSAKMSKVTFASVLIVLSDTFSLENYTATGTCPHPRDLRPVLITIDPHKIKASRLIDPRLRVIITQYGYKVKTNCYVVHVSL